MAPVYTITQITVEDRETYRAYAKAAVPMLYAHGCTVVADDATPDVVEGEWFGPRTIVLKWPSREAALGWYNSPEYQAVLPDRLKSSRANMVLVESLEK